MILSKGNKRRACRKSCSFATVGESGAVGRRRGAESGSRSFATLGGDCRGIDER